MEPVSLATRTEIVDGAAVVSVTGDVDLVSSAHLRSKRCIFLAMDSGM